MTPGMLHDTTLHQSVSKTRTEFPVYGDGCPTNNKAEDAKDLQYWKLGRMMMHHRNLNGGFDKLVIAGLPAFRAVENMQALTGSGLTVPVESYTGFEMSKSKFSILQKFYEDINERLPKFRKMDIRLFEGEILAGLAGQARKFNVFDFDFMVSPYSWRLNLADVPPGPYVRRPSSFAFMNRPQIENLIDVVRAKRRAGPVAIYCNWAAGRLSTENWEQLRKHILKEFLLAFDVECYAWTSYMGNTTMVGLQLILGDNRKKAPRPKVEPKTKVIRVPAFRSDADNQPVDAECFRKIRNLLGWSSSSLSMAMGYSHSYIAMMEGGHAMAYMFHLKEAEKVVRREGISRQKLNILRAECGIKKG